MDLFCSVDDCCAVFMPQWQKYLIKSGERKLNRKSSMNASEIMAIIIIAFHMSHRRDFKNFYIF